MDPILMKVQLFQKKNKQCLRTYFFENPLGIFHFFYFTPGISRQNKALRHKILLDPLEIPRPKAKTPRNFTSFLINPWKFHMLFLWYPWKFHILNPPCSIFFWNSSLNSHALSSHIKHETLMSRSFYQLLLVLFNR